MLEQHAYLLDYFVEFHLALSTPIPSKMLQRSFADGEHIKAQLEQLIVIEKVAAVEKKGGTLHRPQNPLVIQILVELPVCEEGHRMSTFRGAVRVVLKADTFLDIVQVLPSIVQGFGVGDHHLGAFFQQPSG